MKRLQHIFIYPSAFFLCLMSAACNFLEEYSQDTDYVRTWKDLDELLIGGCYLPVEESAYLAYTTNVCSWIHLLGDEVQESQSGYTTLYAEGDNRANAFGYFTWQQRVGINETETDFFAENTSWTKIYYCINVANNIISSVENVPCNSDTERQGVHKVKGEAHFLRAFYYFWLANLYGKPYDPKTATTDLCVPLKVSDVVEDRKFSRQTVAEVYTQVLSDLDIAERELGLYTTPKVSIYRADSTACHLLQSRVYLYMQQWEKAALYAGKVMKEHAMLANLNTASGKFSVKDNPENLFSMGGSDVHNLFNYVCQSFSVSKELYDSYTSSDLRKSQWYWRKGDFIGPVRTTTNPTYFSYDVSESDYYTRAYAEKRRLEEVSGQFLLRSAEAYLNYAEAEAYLGHDVEAQNALNTLRANRLSGTSTVVSTGNELISAIRRERRLELALEGHRWFDLRRYTVCAVQPESHAITHEWTFYSEHSSTNVVKRNRYKLEAYDDAYTLPIPQEVIDFNTGMPNNIRPWRDYITVL